MIPASSLNVKSCKLLFCLLYTICHFTASPLPLSTPKSWSTPVTKTSLTTPTNPVNPPHLLSTTVTHATEPITTIPNTDGTLASADTTRTTAITTLSVAPFPSTTTPSPKTHTRDLAETSSTSTLPTDSTTQTSTVTTEPSPAPINRYSTPLTPLTATGNSSTPITAQDEPSQSSITLTSVYRLSSPTTATSPITTSSEPPTASDSTDLISSSSTDTTPSPTTSSTSEPSPTSDSPPTTTLFPVTSTTSFIASTPSSSSSSSSSFSSSSSSVTSSTVSNFTTDHVELEWTSREHATTNETPPTSGLTDKGVTVISTDISTNISTTIPANIPPTVTDIPPTPISPSDSSSPHSAIGTDGTTTTPLLVTTTENTTITAFPTPTTPRSNTTTFVYLSQEIISNTTSVEETSSATTFTTVTGSTTPAMRAPNSTTIEVSTTTTGSETNTTTSRPPATPTSIHTIGEIEYAKSTAVHPPSSPSPSPISASISPTHLQTGDPQYPTATTTAFAASTRTRVKYETSSSDPPHTSSPVTPRAPSTHVTIGATSPISIATTTAATTSSTTTSATTTSSTSTPTATLDFVPVIPFTVSLPVTLPPTNPTTNSTNLPSALPNTNTFSLPGNNATLEISTIVPPLASTIATTPDTTPASTNATTPATGLSTPLWRALDDNNTIDFEIAPIRYWILTVIDIPLAVDRSMLRHLLADRLSEFYTRAMHRYSLFKAGVWVPRPEDQGSEFKVSRSKRSVEGVSTPPLYDVTIINMTRTSILYPWQTSLIYYITKREAGDLRGNFTDSKNAVSAAILFTPQEMAIILGFVVIRRAVMLDPTMFPKAEGEKKYWIIGVSLASVLIFLILSWCILFMICRSYEKREDRRRLAKHYQDAYKTSGDNACSDTQSEDSGVQTGVKRSGSCASTVPRIVIHDDSSVVISQPNQRHSKRHSAHHSAHHSNNQRKLQTKRRRSSTVCPSLSSGDMNSNNSSNWIENRIEDFVASQIKKQLHLNSNKASGLEMQRVSHTHAEDSEISDEIPAVSANVKRQTHISPIKCNEKVIENAMKKIQSVFDDTFVASKIQKNEYSEPKDRRNCEKRKERRMKQIDRPSLIIPLRKKSDDVPLLAPLVHRPLKVGGSPAAAPPFWSPYDAGDALAAITTPTGQLATPTDSAESLRELAGGATGVLSSDAFQALPIRVQPLYPASPQPLASPRSFSSHHPGTELPTRALGETMSAQELQALKSRRRQRRDDEGKPAKLDVKRPPDSSNASNPSTLEPLNARLKPLRAPRTTKTTSRPLSTPTAFQQAKTSKDDDLDACKPLSSSEAANAEVQPTRQRPADAPLS